MTLQPWQVPPQELHEICADRMRVYDLLPNSVQGAIQRTKWGVSPESMAAYYRGLKSALYTPEEVIKKIEDYDALMTKQQYASGRLKKEFGDA